MKKVVALLIRLSLIAGLMIFTPPEFAVNAQGLSFPAEINKSFTPIAILSGGISRLEVTIYNPNSFQLDNASWTDNLVGVQLGLTIANPANISNTCGGSVTASPGATSLSLSGGTVPAQVGISPGECTVGVDVTSSTEGNLINTIPANALSSTGGGVSITNTTPASATLTVIGVDPPSINKSFSPNTMFIGEVSVLTITINNNDAVSDLTQASLTDNLPANVIIADPALPANALQNCGASATLDATPGGSSITLNNATIAPSLNCVISVNVTSTVAGIYTNTIPANSLTTQQGVTNSSPASAPLNVQAVGVEKAFNPDSFQGGGSTTLTITLQNPTGSDYTGVSISDTLSGAALSVVDGTATTTCGGIASTTLPRTVSLTGGTIPASATPPSPPGTCIITVEVTAPATDTTSTYTNTIPAGALSADQPGVTNILPAVDQVQVYATGTGMSGTKSFNPGIIDPGGNSLLRIRLRAPMDTDLTNFSVTDVLPAGVTISNSSPPFVSANCGPSATLTAVTGSDTITLTNGTIAADTVCRIEVWVTSSTPGTVTNTILPSNITNDQDRAPASNITDNLIVRTLSNLLVSKAFSPNTVAPNGVSTLTITLENTNDLPLVNVSVTDNLPGTTANNTVFVAADPNANTTCGAGVVSATPGSQTIQMTGGTIPAQVGGVPGVCTISVNVEGSNNTGNRTNTILTTDVSGTIEGTTTTINPAQDASATLFVQDLLIGVVKGFNPLTVFGGSASTMSVQLINPNTAALTGINFTDTMPSGMYLASPTNFSVGTCGGVLSGNPGDGSFTFSGGSLTANSTCTLTLSVTMDVNGNLTNTIPVGAVTTANGVSNPDPAEATLTNLAGASVSKFFSPNPIAAGSYSVLTITIQNTSNIPLSGMGLTDALPGVLPNGLFIASSPAPSPVNNCGGTLTAVGGTQDIQLAGGSLAANSSCTIEVAVTSTVPGDYENIIPMGALTNNENATNTQPAIDTLTITAAAALGDFVWSDVDADGIQDAGEAGIANVTVRLLDENGNELDTTTTDANGFYSFTNLAPGTYRVDFIPPTGYSVSPADQGANDAVDSDANPSTGETANVTLAAGEINNTLDAGLYQPAALGNFVWLDADFDGIQDAGEIGVANVTVRLLDENGNELAITTTDANGLYSFTDLIPGTYRVDFVPPAGYTISPANQGANDAVDSDANATTGETANVTLSPGETNNTLDAGLFLQAPGIQVTKTITAVNFVNPDVVQITYSIQVLNTGNVMLSNVQVTDDLVTAFPAPASFRVISLLPGTFSANTGFDGDTDINLLDGTDTLNPGANGVITLVVEVDSGGVDATYTNTVDASGITSSEQEVTDTDSVPGPSFIDPALTKSVDPALALVGDLVTFTITVNNNGNVAADGVVVTDPLPDNLEYVSGTSVDANTSLPRGTVTLIPPRTVQVDIGTVDVTDVITITILAQVNSQGQPPVENEATLTAAAPPQGVSPDPLPNNVSAVLLQIVGSNGGGGGGGGGGQGGGGGTVLAGLIPVTGFAPNRVTDLSGLPVTRYDALSEVTLEVPALKIEMPIVGVPMKNKTWDVNWLLNQAGWLEGSAFPGFSGNSVLTSHVTLPFGQAGPFANLHKIEIGDRVFVRAFGNLYIYEVRSIRKSNAADPSILRHEDKSWLTLVTCADYHDGAETYLSRLVVKAELIQAQPERWWSDWR